MGLSGLLSFGLYGFGYAYFIPASAIAFLYFGRRNGSIITFLSLITIVIIAILFNKGILYFTPEKRSYMESTGMWINMFSTVVLNAVVITMFWNNLYSLLHNTFTHIHHQQTDMKNMNEQLIVARDNAQQSDRLKSAFLQNISHQIRTPLNIIIGFSDMVSETRNAEELKEYNQVIKDNSNIMLKIVNDIVDFSKIETNTLTLNKTEFNIKHVLEEIEEKFRADKAFSIDINIEKIDLQIQCDKERFTQIIFNLLDNALKFTPQGKVELRCEKNENSIHFKINDTGIGITSDEQKKIFDRFYKVDQFSTGSGLGLSLSKSIANYMGGDIQVESKTGKGSTFKFTLPYLN
jgi:signal transduction histidine kinase